MGGLLDSRVGALFCLWIWGIALFAIAPRAESRRGDGGHGGNGLEDAGDGVVSVL